MTEHLDPGHQESHDDWPDPLGRRGWWTLGVWALPAAALSTASAGVLAAVFLWLLHSERTRALMVLPRWISATAAAAAAAAAWWIVLRCRDRPGPKWPRGWVLGLAAGSSATVALVLWLPQHAAVHALALATLAAAGTLVPRLRKLHPDHPMVQHAGPLLAVVMLAAGLLLSGALLGAITAGKASRIDRTLRDLAQWTSTVREMSAYRWPLPKDAPRALAEVKKLEALHPGEAVGDPDLWRSAATLGLGQKVAAAATTLDDAVVAALMTPNAPRLSSLTRPPVDSIPGSDAWKESDEVVAVSEVVGIYYAQLGRILGELEPRRGGSAADEPPGAPDASDSDGQGQLARYCAAKRRELKPSLSALEARWTDGWAARLVPPAAGLPPPAEASLADLLQRPITVTGSTILRPADLPTLMRLSYDEVLGLLHDKALTGCTPRLNYPYKKQRVSRLDCYTYTRRGDGPRAELRAEVRLVYETAWSLRLSAQTPEEVFFLFPLPEGQSAESFKEKVMNDLATAQRDVTGQANDGGAGEPAGAAGTDGMDGVDSGNRTYSMAKGYHFAVGGKRFNACPQEPAPWTEGRQVQQVRVISTECPQPRNKGRKAVSR